MNKFEKYYGYNIVETTTDTDELLVQFKNFLNDPMQYGGMFVVRWSENENFENNQTLKDFVKTNK